jgi:hypothetical protein
LRDCERHEECRNKKRKPRLFGRNKGRPYPSEYETEHEIELRRVLESVGHPDFVSMREGMDRIGGTLHTLPYADQLGEYESWIPFNSIFQQTAFESQYGDIINELARIESRVCFGD